MKKKRLIIFLAIICFMLCGCSDINKMSLEDILERCTSRNVEMYNKYRKGYKYNLPIGLMVQRSTDYNETITDNKYVYYLFVDAVSYYNKVIDTYRVNEDAYVSLPISFEDKYGYLEINKVDGNNYFIEIMYNYAKIEVKVKEPDVNDTVYRCISILTSVHFNDNVLKTMLDEETLQFKEYDFNIFETTGCSEDSEYLQTLKEEGLENDAIVVIHDAARPFVSEALIRRCMEGCSDADGALPCIPVKDTLYQSKDGRSITSLLKRSEIVAGQAPEAFRFGKYLDAHNRMNREEILQISGSTEIAYKMGLNVRLVKGEEINFKITTQEDLNSFKHILSK